MEAHSTQDILFTKLLEISSVYYKHNNWFDDKRVKYSFSQNPSNDDPEQVEKKIHILNSIYHTRVPVKKSIEWITSVKNLEDLLAAHDENAVEEIITRSRQNRQDGGRWSFASKYCHFAKEDGHEYYPIYDSVSYTAVRWLQESGKIEKFDLERYSQWKEAVNLAKRLVKSFDDYKKIDGALYELGYVLENMKEKLENIKVNQALSESKKVWVKQLECCR